MIIMIVIIIILVLANEWVEYDITWYAASAIYKVKKSNNILQKKKE